MDLAAGNFHLSAASPCRDTGNNGYAVGSTDLDGNARIVNTNVDMGAFEYFSIPDADGDGFLDAQEAIAGTNPNDSNSYWKVSAILAGGSLQFSSVTGRLYAADYINNLAATPQLWIEFTNNIPGTGNPIVIQTPATTNRTFRLRVSLP